MDTAPDLRLARLRCGGASGSRDDIEVMGLWPVLPGAPGAVVLIMVAHRGWAFALVSAGMLGWSSVRLFMAAPASQQTRR